jgi:hypothetical protein
VYRLSFGNITPEELLEAFDLSQDREKLVLDIDNIDVPKEIEIRFKKLILEHEMELDRYLEEELKMLFIAPIINSISFSCNGVKVWLERELSVELENISIYGKTDFMLAKGWLKPEAPLFFIQEYKKSIPNGDPKWQLIAEMVTAIELSERNEILGSYIFGRYWYFVELIKVDDKYIFSLSESYDSLKIDDLIVIYKNLQAVKSLYCDN